MQARTAWRRLRAVGVAGALLLSTTVAINVAVTEAQAATPAAPTATPVAPRTNADSGPADLAKLETYVITTAPDGAVLYFDKDAQQIRRVDPNSHTISVVAGSGTTLDHGSLDSGKPALDVPLPDIVGLWTDQAGDIFAWACVGSNCRDSKDLYRLGAADRRWQLVLTNPDGVHGYRWDGIGITPQGDVIAVDETNAVVRRIANGSDATSIGVVVAGTSGVPGTTGDNGPATSASIAPSGSVVVAPSGDIYVATGSSAVRRIDPQGVITTLIDPVAATTPGDSRWTIHALATSADSATVYVQAEASTTAVIRAVPVDGSAPRTVASPTSYCGSGSQNCVGRSIAESTENGTTVVLSGSRSIESWPSDGSEPQRYHRFAGILNDTLGARSPDGTRLDQAYLSIADVAESPSGTYAVAARDGVHTLSGLTPASTITTLAPGVVASSLQYADDGSLYGVVAEPLAHLVRISPAGVVTTILGGGTETPADGVAASDVAFSYATTYAIEPSTGKIIFTDNFKTGNAVWELAAGATSVSAFVDASTLPAGQPVGLAFTPDDSVLIGYYGGLYEFGVDGTVTRLCHDTCPQTNLHRLTNGATVGSDDQNTTVVLGGDGTLEHLAGLGFLTVTRDGRGLTRAQGATAGLLAITEPVAAPTSVDPPTVKVTADPSSSITVRVTTSVANQQARVFAGPQKADGTWSAPPQQYFDATTSGMTTTFVLRHVFTTWPAAAGSVTPGTFRVEVKAVSPGDSTHDEIVNAPQVFSVTPHIDAVAPAAASLKIILGDNSLYLTVGRPADADFDRVIVCKTIGTIAATDPRTCDVADVLTSSSSFPTNQLHYIDPRVATTFTAFAVDDSGNVSAPVRVTRAAPTLVSGDAVSRVYLRAVPGGERVYWADGWASQVRYAAGSTPPATMTDGTLGGQIEDGGGYPDKEGFFSEVPLAAGHTVSVSIFNYADHNLGTYRRTSLVIGAGAAKDALSLTGSTRINAGGRPVLRARVVRGVPLNGVAPLPQEKVQLFSRPVGGSAWTATASAVSAVNGIATFTVPAPRASTQYQARTVSPSPALTSAVVTTSVVQRLSITAPKRVARKHIAWVSGIVTPRHATTVYLQRYLHKRWSTVARTRTVQGVYRFAYRPTAAGTYVLRAMVANERTLIGTQSGIRTLRVK